MAEGQLIALQDTSLVYRPEQSSVLMQKAQPGTVYKIPKDTVLECSDVRWWEGVNRILDVKDGDDYFWVRLEAAPTGSMSPDWFAFAQHFEAKEPEHPEMKDDAFVVSEERKSDAANLIKSASNTAIAEQPSEQKEEDLGPLIQLPGVAFKRPRHIYEPVFWKDGKRAPFTWAELTKGGTRIPETEAIAHNVVRVTKMLTFFRERLAQPIEITSAYRDPASNREVGGALYSRHMNGDSVDWKPMTDGITESIWNSIRGWMVGGGLAISGYDGEPEYGFFHTDMRGGGDPLNDRRGRTFWTYPHSPSWVYGR